MEKLIELVTIVNRIKTRDISVIGRGRAKKGQKVKELYEGIAKGKFKSDKDAAIYIYGKNYSSTSYSSLKNHLTERLLNSLFFINLSDFQSNDFQKAYFEVHKLGAIIKILAGKGAKTSSIALAEKIIQKSLKYEFTEVNLDLARFLRRHYRTLGNKSPKAEKFDKIVKEQLNILIAETEVEDYYAQLIQGLGMKRSTKDNLVLRGKEFAEKVRLIFPKIQSFKLGQFSHLIFVLEHELTKDYESVEHACQVAISYYKSKGEFGSIEKILVFYIKLLSAYIPLKKFQEGEIVADKILKAIIPSSINWFLTLDHYFLLAMHTGNYKKGNEIFQIAINDKGFKKLKPYFKEIWSIYESYLEYLKEAGILEKSSTKNFRVARFVNEVPNFSKDKKGLNISILIIQALLLIAQEKEFRVIDKVDALRTYVYTYLRNDESLRSNCFIKMLVKTVESNFHKNATIRKTKILQKKLSEANIGTKGYSQYVEIIPYETLWDISLRFLSNRAF